MPATCGELVQGVLDGRSCLVSCPIDRYGVAFVEGSAAAETPEWRVPPRALKAAAMLRAGMAHFGESVPAGRLWLRSDLPAGRGYGSSTVDVGATLYALAGFFGRSLPKAEAARLAVQVEPSDSTLFPGLALFDHREGSFHECLGPAPALAVIVLDPGGEVDTLAYNREVTPESLRRFSAEHREAFGLLRTGLTERDWARVGQAATLSAQTHQAILFNPFLDAALAACRTLDGLGVCRAHSGTLLGLLLDTARTSPEEALVRVRRLFPDPVRIYLQAMVDGGARP